MSEVKICIKCNFCEQGPNCSFCSNPKQTDKDLKKYVYWNFSCGLFEEGISKSRVKYQLDRNDISK